MKSRLSISELNSALLQERPVRPQGCKCDTCCFRSTNLAQGGCNYLLVTGHARILACPRPKGSEEHVSDFCTCYQKGAAVQDPLRWRAKKAREEAERKAHANDADLRKPTRRQKMLAAEKAAAECYAKGGTDDEICEAAGRSRAWVLKWRCSHDLPINACQRASRKKSTAAVRREIAAEMYHKGATDAEISDYLHLSKRWAENWRQVQGLPPNKKKESK